MNSFLQQTQSPLLKQRIFAAYKWIIVAPFLVFSTTIIGAIIAIFSLAGFANFASRVLATAWARINANVSLMQVRVKGSEKVDPQQSYIVVANHQSLIDVYVLYGYLGFDIKWVMKKELRSVPVLGIVCDLLGHIYIDRSNTEAAVASINDARHRIIDGISVVFFPEGTRSGGSELKLFKKGAFRLAQQLELPVLPVVIRGTGKILPSATVDLAPGVAELELLDPIPTTGMTPSDVNDLTHEVQMRIQAALDQS